MITASQPGPLILGSSGRIGRMFRTLFAAGAWPGECPPVWHARTDPADLTWDMKGQLPQALPPCRGMIVLAGRTTSALDANSVLALRALDLAEKFDIGPVLICSSSAVYGRAAGPVSEESPLAPINSYGEAKVAMEDAVRKRGTPACCLRIGNVAGADAAMLAATNGPVTLDVFDDGRTSERMYIGPATLANVMLQLLNIGQKLPPVLNVAQPGAIQMGALLGAAGVPWKSRPAPRQALRNLSLDLSKLEELITVPPATAASLAKEATQSGWRAAK